MIVFNIEEYESVVKLRLSGAEREEIVRCAETITNSFDALVNINTENIPPLISVLELNNILREDKSEKLITRDELLKNAPEHSDGYFRVPGTLE